jgi:hypothetical protein
MTEKKEMRIAKIGDLPDLHKAKVSKLELSPEYWTPEKEGEFKVGVITEIVEADYKDEKTGETIKLPCIVMIVQDENGDLSAIKNGSKRLVGTIEDLIASGVINYDDVPIKISYKGKKTNQTNAFKSDTWSVRKIIV